VSHLRCGRGFYRLNEIGHVEGLAREFSRPAAGLAERKGALYLLFVGRFDETTSQWIDCRRDHRGEFYLYLGSLWLLVSPNTGAVLSFPQSLFPALLGFCS
jgi:hypothetical protein